MDKWEAIGPDSENQFEPLEIYSAPATPILGRRQSYLQNPEEHGKVTVDILHFVVAK